MKRFLCGLKYIFIPVLCIFLMSHNTFALSLNEDVSFVGSRQSVWFRTGSRNCRSGGNSCGWANEDWSASVYTMFTNANTTTRLYDLYIELPVNSVQAGDYIVQTLYVWQDGLSVSGHSFVQSIAYGGVNNVSVVDVQFESFSVNSGMITIISRANAAFTDSDLKFVGNPSGTGVLDLAGGYTSSGTTGPAYMRPGTASLWRPRTQVDNSAAINSINNQLPAITNNLQNMNNALNDIKNSIQNQNQEEEDAVQDAADDSAAAGDQSSADAASATTGFISAIGGFVSAITNASPSNCNINANLNHLNLGVLDLCSMPVPSYITIIGSIIAIMLVIPFCIVMFNRFIGLFRSFQG